MSDVKISATAEEVMDSGNGACLACGERVEGGIEPDAREYTCESCGENKVYGLQELLFMGRLELDE